MKSKRVLNIRQLGMLAFSLLMSLIFLFGITYSALQDTKTATGTITFSGDLALAMQHGAGNYVSGDTLSLQLIPDYVNIVNAEDTGNVYFIGQTGQVSSLKWEDNASGENDIIFKVFSDGQTSAYIKMTLQLKYTPKQASYLPQTAQEWQVYPKFGSSSYEMTYTQIEEDGNKEYSFYGPSDRLVVTYPKFERTENYVTKTFEMYYLAEDFETLQSFSGTMTESYNGYTTLNKEINFSNIISDVQFLISGTNQIRDGDQFEMSINCQASVFPSL